MRDHQVTIDAATSAVELEQLLDARPTSWLRPFLVLALAAAPGAATAPWFRVRRVPAVDDALAAWSLHWRPHRGPACFEDLVGRLAVSGDAARTRLALTARVEGGERDATDRALRSLLQMLDAALAERQDAG